MPDTLKVATVQFEMAQADKPANLAKMERFIEEAARQGCQAIAFPEICTTGYHFLTQLSRDDLVALAEDTENGPTVRFIRDLSARHGIHVLFGLLEIDPADQTLYNTYVVIGPEGRIFQHRKVHAFENSEIKQGDRLETFELLGWRCGILICYDNNLPENGRVLALNGAEILFAPHQTGGFDIWRAGMGTIPHEVWKNRHLDPLPMKEAILGLKGRAWITKWLPARAYDNNYYVVFANGVGIDGPEVRVGCNMICDPEGIIIAETTDAEDDMVVATLKKSAREGSLAGSHMAARRPSLYGKIVEPVPEVDTRTIRNRVSNEKIR